MQKLGFVNLFAIHGGLLERRQGIDKSSPPPLRQAVTWLYFINIMQTPALTVVVNLPRYVFLSSLNYAANPCLLHHPDYSKVT